jgi:hypothetical protein
MNIKRALELADERQPVVMQVKQFKKFCSKKYDEKLPKNGDNLVVCVNTEEELRWALRCLAGAYRRLLAASNRETFREE